MFWDEISWRCCDLTRFLCGLVMQAIGKTETKKWWFKKSVGVAPQTNKHKSMQLWVPRRVWTGQGSWMWQCMSESCKLARAVRPGPLFSLCALKQKTARHRNWDEISSKIFLYIRIQDFFYNFCASIQKCTQIKENEREYYLRKYFNPLLLESAVMYDDNGIILGSGTYAPWWQAIWSRKY